MKLEGIILWLRWTFCSLSASLVQAPLLTLFLSSFQRTQCWPMCVDSFLSQVLVVSTHSLRGTPSNSFIKVNSFATQPTGSFSSLLSQISPLWNRTLSLHALSCIRITLLKIDSYCQDILKSLDLVSSVLLSTSYLTRSKKISSKIKTSTSNYNSLTYYVFYVNILLLT